MGDCVLTVSLDVMEIEIADASRDIKRFTLFPSAHMSYDAGKAGVVTAGYSYRTNRPGIWLLEPYITYEDYYTKKMGNPDILPEYAHSGEIGWNKSFRSGNSLALTGYYRYRNDISEWIRRPYEPGVTLDIIVNAGDQIEKGLEFSGVLKPLKWWTSTLASSVFHYEFMSENEACTDASGYFYLVNWVNAFNAAKKTKVQFDSHFVGPKILSQGNEKSYYYFDLAIRQQLLNDKITLSLVTYDIFRTARYENERITSGLSSFTSVHPKYPSIMLSLNYNFNSSKHKSTSVSSPGLFEGKDF